MPRYCRTATNSADQPDHQPSTRCRQAPVDMPNLNCSVQPVTSCSHKSQYTCVQYNLTSSVASVARRSRGRFFAREIDRFAGLTVCWQLLHQSPCEIEIENMAASRIYLYCCMCPGVLLALPGLCKRDLNGDATNTLKPGICSMTPTISSQAVKC